MSGMTLCSFYYDRFEAIWVKSKKGIDLTQNGMGSEKTTRYGGGGGGGWIPHCAARFGYSNDNNDI